MVATAVHLADHVLPPLPVRQWVLCTMGHIELAQLAQSANVRNLVLSHVTSQFDRPGMREHVLREVCGIFKGNAFFGEYLMAIPFASPAASRLN